MPRYARDVAVDAIRQENAEERRWTEAELYDVAVLMLAGDAVLLSYRAQARWNRSRSLSWPHFST